MLAFYMDHHVHRGVTDGLRSRGVDVITAFEDGMHLRDDNRLLERAAELGRILVTQDQDFLEIVPQWQASARSFPGVVFGIQQRLDIGRMIDYLELVASVMSTQAMQNRIEFIPG
jgi:hypothetical protein